MTRAIPFARALLALAETYCRGGVPRQQWQSEARSIWERAVEAGVGAELALLVDPEIRGAS